MRTLQEKDGWVAGEILDIVYQHARPDAVAMHLNLAAFAGRGDSRSARQSFGRHRAPAEEMAGCAHFVLALRSDGSPQLDEKKRNYRDKACGRKRSGI